MKEIKEIIRGNLLSTKKKAMGIIGPAGVGKSDIIKELALELDRPIKELRAGYKTPGDLLGVPYKEEIFDDNGLIVDKVTAFLKPKWVKELQDNPNTIFVLEEISNATPEVQGSLYEILLDWAVNEVKIPETVNILFTGNRAEDAIGIATDLQSTIYTRATILKITPNDVTFEDWKEWALKSNIHLAIISYLELNQRALLHEVIENSSYCTPRTWAILSQNLKDNEYLLKSNEKLWKRIVTRLVLTAIPEENAFLYHYLDGLKLKPVEEYINNPALYTRDDDMFMQVTYNIAHYICNNPKKVNQKWIKFFDIISNREGLRELPVLISVLNSTNKDWIKNIQVNNIDLGTEIGEAITPHIEEMKKVKSGNF